MGNDEPFDRLSLLFVDAFFTIRFQRTFFWITLPQKDDYTREFQTERNSHDLKNGKKNHNRMILRNKAHKSLKQSTLTSHGLHEGLFQSVQPLHARFPTIITPKPVLSPRMTNAPFSFRLQPHMDVGYLNQYQTGLSSVAPHHLMYTASALAAPSAMSYLKLFLVFTAGGLFFSTALAIMSASYAMGMDNIRRVFEILGIIILRVWATFTIGLGATKLALFGESTTTIELPKEQQHKSAWKWKSAWIVLKEKLDETRKTAAEGVQALREEAKLYAAAVGAPGLIPLQHIVDRLMPLSFSSILEDSIKDALSSLPSTSSIKKMTLSSFTAGNRAPILLAARVYDVDNAISFDYDIKWDSQLEATVQIYTAGGLARVPVKIQHLAFEGVVRVILTPLTKAPPGYGAMLISLPTPPKINMDVSVLGGEVTKLPFLKREITAAFQKALSDELLWPRRSVVPSMLGSKTAVLDAKKLAALESSDPLLLAEESLKAKQPMLRPIHDSKNQRFNGKIFQVFRKDEKSLEDQESEPDVVASETMHIDKSHHDHKFQNAKKGVLWEQWESFSKTTIEQIIRFSRNSARATG